MTRALELKRAGLTYAEIAARMCISRQMVQKLCKPPAEVYAQLRVRANNSCEKCKRKIMSGHAHHVQYGSNPWDLNDLLHLCTSCHTKEHMRLEGHGNSRQVHFRANAQDQKRLAMLREKYETDTAGAIREALRMATWSQEKQGEKPNKTRYS